MTIKLRIDFATEAKEALRVLAADVRTGEWASTYDITRRVAEATGCPEHPYAITLALRELQANGVARRSSDGPFDYWQHN
jgi:hypothetical protein